MTNKRTLVPIREAADRTGVKKDTIWKWIRRGRIRVFRYPYGARVILEDVETRKERMTSDE